MQSSLVYAINKYIHNKDDSSFDIKIIKILSLIYDEIELINPILLNDYKLLNNNLLKYFKTPEDLEKFKHCFDIYMAIINNASFYK